MLKELNSLVVQVENTAVLHHRSLQAASRARKREAQQVCFSMSFFRSLILERMCLGGLAGASYESGLAEGAGGGYGASSYESSSFSSGVGGGAGGYGADAGFSSGAGGSGGQYGAGSYESSSYSSGGAGGFDAATAAFNNADRNKDGTVDANEFKQFYQGGL